MTTCIASSNGAHQIQLYQVIDKGITMSSNYSSHSSSNSSSSFNIGIVTPKGIGASVGYNNNKSNESGVGSNPVDITVNSTEYMSGICIICGKSFTPSDIAFEKLHTAKHAFIAAMKDRK